MRKYRQWWTIEKEEGGHAVVSIEINMDALVRFLGRKALRTKSGRAKWCKGRVKVKVVKRDA